MKRENVADQGELFDENQQAEGEGPSEVPKGEKKRVRLTVGVKPEEGREKKKKVPKVWGIKQRHGGRAASITLATERS